MGLATWQISPREQTSCWEPGGGRKTMGAWGGSHWLPPLPPDIVVGRVCWGAVFAPFPKAPISSQSEKVTKLVFAFPDRVPRSHLGSLLHPFPPLLPQLIESQFPAGSQVPLSRVGRSWFNQQSTFDLPSSFFLCTPCFQNLCPFSKCLY